MSLINKCRNFLSDRAGNVAMIFAFAAIPIAGMVGGAVDFQMGVSERSQMQDALDAATLAVMSRPAAGNLASRQTQLQSAYRANGGRGTVRIRRDLDATSSVMVFETAAEQRMPTNVMGIVGVPTLNLGVTAAARRREVLQSLRFRLRYITGAYDKRISLMGRLPGQTAVTELMNIQYSWPRSTGGTTTTVRRLVNGTMTDTLRVTCPSHSNNLGCTTQVLSGDGTATVNVEGYEHLYLQMTVSGANSVARSYIWPGMPLTIRTDDPNLSYRLFMAGNQISRARRSTSSPPSRAVSGAPRTGKTAATQPCRCC